MDNNISIIAFTENGRNLINKIQKSMEINLDIWNSEEEPVRDFIARKYVNTNGFIFIGAIGIVFRLLKDHITTKDKDPFVVVCDDRANYIIPVLSGHIGGGNEFATKLAIKLNAIPVLTTATDVNNKFAIDVWAKKHNCQIIPISNIKHITKNILEDTAIGLQCNFKTVSPYPFSVNLSETKVGVSIGLNSEYEPFEKTLHIIPKIITVGVGCRKNTDINKFEKFILETLSNLDISIHAVEQICSIELKSNEPCILKFSEKYNIPFHTATADALNEIEGNFPTSEFVKKITGVDNVCERSAKLFSNNGDIILHKTSFDSMTISIAKKDWECNFEYNNVIH